MLKKISLAGICAVLFMTSRRITQHKISLLVIVLSLIFQVAGATGNYWVGGASGAWNVATNWSTTSSSTVGGGNGVIPTSTTDVIFDANSVLGAGGAITINTITGTLTIHSLTVSAGSSTVTLTASTAASVLQINNAATSNPTALSVTTGSTLVLGGTNAFTLDYITTTGQVSTITGTLQVNGNNTYNATNSVTTVSGTITNGTGSGSSAATITSSATSLLFAGTGITGIYNHNCNAGTLPTALWVSGINYSTVNITGTTTTNPTWVAGTYGNVNWNTTGQTINGLLNTGITVGGNLSVLTGTFGNSAALTLSVTGTTSISNGATFNYASTGAATFTGAVTVNGVWNNSAVATFAFGNSLTVNTGATFTASTGVYTFSGTAQAIGGTLGAISIPNVAITGTIINNMTTSPGLYVSTALSGGGTLTQGSSAILTLGGTAATGISVSTLNCTTNTPNTVVYNGASPTIKATTYNNLTSSVSGTATLAAATSIANSLAVTTGILSDGGSQITGNSSGTLNVSNGATLQLGAAAGTTEGFPTLFTTANITLGATSTVNYNTTGAQPVAASVASVGPATYGNLTVTGASVKTVAAGGTITVAGALTIATVGETFADNGVIVTVNGNVTNNGTHSGTGEILLTGSTGAHTVTGTTDTYGKLELNDANGATFANTSTTTTVGTLLVTAGTLTLNSFTTGLTVTTTTVSGTLTFNNATGTRTMGAVTVNTGGVVNVTVAQATPLITVTSLNINGGTWNDNTVNEPVTINSGGSFTNTGTFNSGTGTYTFAGGTQSINGNATTFASITVSSTTCTNNITASPGLTITTTVAGAGTLAQAANALLVVGATAFTPALTATASGNMVTYNGAANQTIKGTTYVNLVSSPSISTVVNTLNAVTTVNGGLTVSSGTLSDGGFQITGNSTGLLSVAAGATLQLGVAGATTDNFPTAFTNANITLAATSTVVYNTTSNITIPAIPNAYSNLTISSTAVRTLAAAITVNGNLAINGGTLADGGFQITGNSTGTLTAASGATLQIGAGTNTTETFPTNFTTANIALNAASTVNYSWITGTTQVVAGSIAGVGPSTYGNLTITGVTGTKTAASPITVAGTLTIASNGETFADGGNTITVNGNVVNNATYSGAGEIKITGGSIAHTITSPTGTSVTATFGNLEIADATYATTISNTFTTAGTTNIGTLNVSAGTLNVNAFTTAFAVTGTTTVAGSLVINSTTGTKTFTGDVTVNGIWNNTVNGAVSVAGNLAVNTGATFTAGSGVYTFSGTAKTIGGTLGTITIPNTTITGSINNALTTSPGLNVTTALAGAGSLIQATNAILTIGGTSTTGISITTLNCTTNVPNTVVYNGASPTVKTTTYNNLTSSVSGTAVLAAAVTIANNFSVTTGIFSDGGVPDNR